MTNLSNKANWAVRIPPPMEKEHDIIQASPSLLESSPSPFGLKICTLQSNDSFEGSPQRLFYVSEQAAQDRAPEKHAMNGVGVHPGWYMIAEQGIFHIHAGVVKERMYAKKSGNGFVVCLTVDGQDTNRSILYRRDGAVVKGHPSIWHGFRRSYLIDPCTWTKSSKFDKFCFENIADAVEGKNCSPTETGMISMHVYAGRVYENRMFDQSHTEYSYSKQQISAKTVAREGRSIRVGSSGFCKAESKPLLTWGIDCMQIIENARINVFVRSRHWLRSRRVIDDYDQPFKYADLVKARNGYVVAGRKRAQVLSILNGTERPRKRRHDVKKEKELLNNKSQEQSPEIVDLT